MGLLRAELIQIIKYIQNMDKPVVCMMGNQEIYADRSDIKKLCDLYGFDYDRDFFSEKNKDEKIDSRAFFKAVGANEVHALDYSEYEHADIIFDLNSQELPDELYERFDMLIDGGVLEHIFHPGIALNNMANMVKSGGGVIYHMVPLAGFVDHGFYSFSPTFFQDFYNVDMFQLDLLRMQYKPIRGIYKFVFYSMDCRLFQCADGMNQYIQKYWDKGGEVLLQCIVRKLYKPEIRQSCETPLQGRYVQIYGDQL